ncbi:MAG: hypothetical protein JWO86_8006 [Myxococcaceae bacterium]|nr:hypothetical protein [Myxococcaceae bacterium]
MRSDSWVELVECVLRPARPDLERCAREREHYAVARRPFAEARARAVAQCVGRIESLRAAAFAANDGVVTSQMTELEREWRRLSRPDPDAGLMDLWARIGPAAWLDRKRWRDSEPSERLDAAIALASDVEGVVAAESAIDELRSSLAPWGISIGARVRWRFFDGDRATIGALLVEPLRFAQETVTAPNVRERARRVEREVEEAARTRFPERPLLVRDLAHAALVDSLWSTGPRTRSERTNPVTALRALWKTGYVLSAFDASSVTLELPPLALT